MSDANKDLSIVSLLQSLRIEVGNITLYQQALTHKSFSKSHNERLEYLGDALIGFVIGEALFKQFPDKPEGDLSRYRAQLVKRETLAELSLALGLPDLIRLGTGEVSSGGAKRPSILADCFEAFCGALYLDKGFDQAKLTVLGLFSEKLSSVLKDAAEKDPKTALQELLQSRKLDLPNYKVIQSAGDDHQKSFTVECQIANLGIYVSAEGSSKKNAQKLAASLALEKMKEINA